MSQQLNLFNPVFLRQKKYFSAVTMLQCLAIVLVALIAVFGFQLWQLSDLKRQLANTDTQLRVAQQQLVEITKSKRLPSEALKDQVTRLEAQAKAQEALLTRLDSGELGNTDGFARYLEALARQTVHGVWLTGFSATGAAGPQTIRGKMLQPELLPIYLRMLNKEEALRGHGFEALQLVSQVQKTETGTDARYVEFVLGATSTRGAR